MDNPLVSVLIILLVIAGFVILSLLFARQMEASRFKNIDKKIGDLEKTIERRDKQLDTKQTEIDKRDKTIEEMKLALANSAKELEAWKKQFTSELNSRLGKLDTKVGEIKKTVDNIPRLNTDVIDGPQPDKPSKYQLWHSCERKVAYDTYIDAQIGAEEYAKRYNKEYSIYHCRYCHKYHLATDHIVRIK